MSTTTSQEMSGYSVLPIHEIKLKESVHNNEKQAAQWAEIRSTLPMQLDTQGQ